MLAVAADAGQALGEHAAHVVVDRGVEPVARAEAAGLTPRAVSPQITRRAPTWPGPEITVATATGSPRSTAVVDVAELGERLPC